MVVDVVDGRQVGFDGKADANVNGPGVGGRPTGGGGVGGC